MSAISVGATAGICTFIAGALHARCELYEHRDFGGLKSFIESGDGRDWGATCHEIGNSSWACSRHDFNDMFSSVYVPHGCTLEVYEHETGQGASRAWSGREVYYVGDAWNDQISSARCWCD